MAKKKSHKREGEETKDSRIVAGPLNVYELVQQARAVLERPGGGLDSGGPHPGALTKRRGMSPKSRNAPVTTTRGESRLPRRRVISTKNTTRGCETTRRMSPEYILA
jgi:hypothetical protein